MDRLHQILILDLLPNLGVYKLLQRLGKLEPFSIFQLSSSDLTALGFNASQIALLRNPPMQKLAVIEEWLKSGAQRKIISYFDDDYPRLLKEIHSPPMLLFCQGNSDLLCVPQLAMVGSRAATISGKETAKKLASGLARSGWCITSGLAAGIDSYAHRGALQEHGHTVAVMGCGLNTIYPRSNITLASDITTCGLLVSEFWPDVTPRPELFPRRNRIVSGLSYGVIVVEAAQNSGSLITARLAAEQNRDVFAVPGSINNPKVAGCHKLIAQGAKLITNVADILEEFSHFMIDEKALQRDINIKQPPNCQIDPILECIGFETTAVDVIAQRSGVGVEQVLEKLLTLELSGHILAQSGGFIRTKGEA